MWFEAMAPSPHSGWFFNLLGGLLHGDRGTLSLLRTNPFPDAPPRYVRAQYYRYRSRRPTSAARAACGGTGSWSARSTGRCRSAENDSPTGAERAPSGAGAQEEGPMRKMIVMTAIAAATLGVYTPARADEANKQ